MKKIISVCFMFLAFMLCFNFVNATTGSINVSATEDSYTYNNSADTNYGNAINLYVRTNVTPEIQDTYLEYIINDIPDDQEIDNAEVCIYTDLINDGGKNVTIYLLSENIVENVLKWSDDYRQYILYDYNVSYEFNNSNIDKYTCVDITDLVSYAYSQDEVFLDLIIIGSDINNGTVRFSSKEGSYPTFLVVDYLTDYSDFCQYNALKGGTITTCNDFQSSYHCTMLFDEKTDTAGGISEWITDFTVPPNVARVIINMDTPFYFDRVESWQRTNVFDEVGCNIGLRVFEVSVYSPDTDTWYLLFNETDVSTKEGYVLNSYEFGGELLQHTPVVMLPYIKNVDTIYLGNLSISKVQAKVYDTLCGNDDLHVQWGELAFCVMGESDAESSYANVTTYEDAGLGVGCDTNADCECNLCEYGFCALRTTNMNCVINETSRNDCCLSGTCSGGKCTKNTLWQGIQSSKDQQFGDDTMTNNVISLFFIIGIAGFLMYHGNVIGGIFALYILSIFFTIVGWLSPFILIGMIITGLIAIVFRIMLGTGTE